MKQSNNIEIKQTDKESKIKEYTTVWNHIDELPNIGEEIKLNFGNGDGTDRRFPYKVESIKKHKREDFNVYNVEGRQLKVDGSFRNIWFQLFFTNK